MDLKRIAVLDDEDFIREIIVEVLEEEVAFHITPFDHPSEMIMRGEEFDLIISDYNFKGVDLSFFMNNINKEKLVILSGSAGIIDIECVAVIEKNRTPHLREIIKAILRRLSS